MKLIIAGSRSIDLDPDQISIDPSLVKEVVCGLAKGVDLAGKEWANRIGIPVKEFPADWHTYGKQAGFIRNQEMAQYADELLAYWDGKSNGTRNMIKWMVEYEKPFQVVLIR